MSVRGHILTILALCMYYEPNKLFACPLLCCFIGDNSPIGRGEASGLHGETTLPSLSLSSSVEKLEENRALQMKFSVSLLINTRNEKMRLPFNGRHRVNTGIEIETGLPPSHWRRTAGQRQACPGMEHHGCGTVQVLPELGLFRGARYIIARTVRLSLIVVEADFPSDETIRGSSNLSLLTITIEVFTTMLNIKNITFALVITCTITLTLVCTCTFLAAPEYGLQEELTFVFAFPIEIIYAVFQILVVQRLLLLAVPVLPFVGFFDVQI